MTAIAAAKEIADIDADTKINLRPFPREKTTAEQIEDIFGGSAEVSESLTQMNQILQLPEVQAAIKMRNSSKIGAEMTADLPEIK